MALSDILIVVSGALILIFVMTIFYTLKEELNGDAKLNKDALRKFALQCFLSFFAFIFACIALYLGYFFIINIFSYQIFYSLGLFILMWIFILLLFLMLNLFIDL